MMSDTIKTTENSQNRSHSPERGNAMIYVLIALALFGFLTMTLSRQGDQADEQNIDDEQAALYATELIEYAASAQQAIDMMLYSGSDIDDLDFINPTSGTFNTPPHMHKVYHPQGGGLSYVPEFSKAMQITGTSQWYHSTLSNIEWTPTAALDVSFNALRIPQQVCEIINKKITGNTDIPELTTTALSRYFQETAPNDPLTAAVCPDCFGYVNLCIATNGGVNYGFYNVIAAQ